MIPEDGPAAQMFANYMVPGVDILYHVFFRPAGRCLSARIRRGRVQKSAKTSAMPNEVSEDSLGGNHLQILQTFGSVAASKGFH
ncbi:hypothetical protein K439DRAFT_1641779 [Ramaria rubella]|nr:hypothetical protein K439DRAFT_1641779 [Ramaria rubella]